MRVLVTGVNGQLGYDVIRELTRRSIECRGVDIDDLDITKKEDVETYLKDYRPDVLVHCAAYTAVDAAEDNEGFCYRINVEGTEYLAEACERINAKMMYFSSDYVYNGEGDKPWVETDETDPLNVYGRTKFLGEEAVRDNVDEHFIIRTSWVFGKNGSNFIKAMLRLSETRDELTVVDDQIGSPTYTLDLAKLVVEMIRTEDYGTYLATNEGYCSWYEFACEIFRQAGKTVNVIPIDSDVYPQKARRPKNSRLSKEKLTANGFKKLPDWQDALARYLVEIEVSEAKHN